MGGYYFWDDVHGMVLDSAGVRKARMDEIDFTKKMMIFFFYIMLTGLQKMIYLNGWVSIQ